jgi:hypothetical protein
VSYETILNKLAKKNPIITLRHLDKKMILFEGNAVSLKFLGYLLLARAEADASDCGNQFSPDGARSQLFSKDSTLGVYLHRLPCNEHKLKGYKKK